MLSPRTEEETKVGKAESAAHAQPVLSGSAGFENKRDRPQAAGPQTSALCPCSQPVLVSRREGDGLYHAQWGL